MINDSIQTMTRCLKINERDVATDSIQYPGHIFRCRGSSPPSTPRWHRRQNYQSVCRLLWCKARMRGPTHTISIACPSSSEVLMWVSKLEWPYGQSFTRTIFDSDFVAVVPERGALAGGLASIRPGALGNAQIPPTQSHSLRSVVVVVRCGQLFTVIVFEAGFS
jgi:hypothetical protein